MKPAKQERAELESTGGVGRTATSPRTGQVNSPVYLPVLCRLQVGSLGYFESELLLDFGSVLSGMADELPG